MRQPRSALAGVKSNAFWGSRSGDTRRLDSKSPSGTRGRLLVTLLLLIFLTVPLAPVPTAAAGSGGTSYTAFMTSTLANAVKANPSALFRVIVKGTKGTRTSGVATAVTSAIKLNPAPGATIRLQYAVINGVATTMTGGQISGLSHNTSISSIAQDVKVGETALSNSQLWPDVAQVSSFWTATSTAPAIAIVDSGIDAGRVNDFGGRVIARQNFVPANVNTNGDGYGHGTFVASIAAGQAAGYSGGAAGANLVDLDVLDDTGAGSMSDVINACDWIYRNKTTYGIKVANFSLNAGSNSSFMYDPLDQAVEKLWLSGVVVVTAAGNYASAGLPSGVLYSPANDPFAITVGAADISNTLDTADDFNAPWSAYGYTLDGFSKPELGAPGRYMNGAVPTAATMYVQHPERAVAVGYMWMSGTSFAAPVVAGAAADLLDLHPTWTPDQVKGALMLTAAQTSTSTGPYALGVGDVQASAAAAVKKSPPNPNAGLEQYLTTEANGGQVFDAASWVSAAKADASWNSASWNSASWNSASWVSGQTSDGSLATASWASLIWVG